ncbi:MAG: hypothetical protein IKV81_03760 [Clostridia bacterium]|nr:hypothetical protein [Clostridia bacterium]
MSNKDRLAGLCKEKIRTMKFLNSDHWFDFTTKLERIVDYLLANGVIVPPCKVGDVVYYIHETFYDNEYMKAKEDEIDFSRIIKVVERPNCKTNLMLEKAQFDWLLMDSWLKGDVFLTKEEAEAELEKRGKENDL